MPTDIAIPYGAQAVNVGLLAKDGGELRAAVDAGPQGNPQEEDAESEGPSPS
jgi:hypothetical protein